MNPQDYINHSGGAKGADMKWDEIGREFGVVNHKHYRPEDYINAPQNIKNEIDLAIFCAAQALGRPYQFKGVELVKRNWFQVNGGEIIFAVSRIIKPGEFDKGFENKSGKEVVSGGTGWAVEMAIQIDKPVFVYDMNNNKWYLWEKDKFNDIKVTPFLPKNFAGIGSRFLTPEAEQAIRDVYITTFEFHKLFI